MWISINYSKCWSFSPVVEARWPLLSGPIFERPSASDSRAAADTGSVAAAARTSPVSDSESSAGPAPVSEGTSSAETVSPYTASHVASSSSAAGSIGHLIRPFPLSDWANSSTSAATAAATATETRISS